MIHGDLEFKGNFTSLVSILTQWHLFKNLFLYYKSAMTVEVIKANCDEMI